VADLDLVKKIENLSISDVQKSELETICQELNQELLDFSDILDTNSLLERIVSLEVFIKDLSGIAEASKLKVADYDRLEAELFKKIGVSSLISVSNALNDAVETSLRLLKDEHSIGKISQYFDVNFSEIEGVILKPDKIDDILKSSDSGEKFEIKYQARIQSVLQGLLDNGVDSKAISIVSGNILDTQVRKVSYSIIRIKDYDGDLLVCNQVGEASFYLKKSREDSFYAVSGKEVIKDQDDCSILICRKLSSWSNDAVNLLLKDQDTLNKFKDKNNESFELEAVRYKNIQTFLSQHNIKKLEDLNYGLVRSVAKLLDINGEFTKESYIKCIKELIQSGYLNSDIPENYNFTGQGKGKRSVYFNSEIVGEEKAKVNLEKAVKDFIVKNEITLENLKIVKSLFSILDIEKMNKTLLAKELVIRGYLDANVPDDYFFKGKGKVRWRPYLDPEIVGKEKAKVNVEKVVKDYIARKKINLENLTRNDSLSSILDLDNKSSKNYLAKELVARGYLDSNVPENYNFSGVAKGNWRPYFDPKIVGKEQTEKNLRRAVKGYIASHKVTLDNLTINKSLLSILSLEINENKTPLAKELVARGYIDSNVPDDYIFNGKGKGNWRPYLDPEIVGEKQAKVNLEKVVKDHIVGNKITLENLTREDSLSSILGLDNKSSKNFLAKELVDRGYIDSNVPDGYIFNGKGKGNWRPYLDPEIIGEEQAEVNLEKVVKDYIFINKITLENLGKDIALSSILGLVNKEDKTLLAKELVARGYL